MLARAFPAGSGYVVAGDASDVVIVHSARWTATEPAFRAFVEELVRAVRATGSATDVRSYLSGDRAL
ncbi:MAG: hypothetical protein ACLP1Q_11425, partial [Solirubrobacteraceae bacterium]